jgi:NitT/TauT family transport system substrate-binding protein
MAKYLKVALIGVLVVAGVLAVFLVWRKSHSTPVGQSASSKPIRIGTNRALGTVIPYVARDRGLFQQGNLQVQIVDFNDVTTLMEAFASGQIDVALLGIAPSAIWQEKGVGLKVVAAANGGGHVLLTRGDTGINDLSGLKGKKVATPKPGTVTDTLFRAHIVQDLAKLDPDKDIKVVAGLSAADLPTVLFVSREVDAAITWEPFASQAEAKFKNVKVLFDASEEWRKSNPQSKQLYPVNVVIARQSFIDTRSDELRRFLDAHVRAIQFINEHPDEANDIIARETGLDKAIVVHARKRIDYTAQVDVDASRQTLQWSKQLRYLKEVPSAEKLFDLKYLPHAQ